MTRFPHTVDLQRSSHFLFEAGSLMMAVFGVLFVGSLPLVGLLYMYNVWVDFGLIALSVFGLLGINGLILVLLSTQYDQ